ncbi:uncharacterized protein [Littorina saxatilis]|uniref:Apple domain-containing protein n=1 Tax=Littorina saxatilis TaxID=31220 RepID=A0AAN9BC47_9CAEN
METHVLFLLTLTLAALKCHKCAVYTMRRDLKLTLNVLTSVTFKQHGNNVGRCITSCKQNAACCSVNVHWDGVTSSVTCELLSSYLHEVEQRHLLPAPGWVFVQEDPVYTEGGWALAFRATSAIGQSVWDTWHHDGRHDDTNEMQACLLPVSSAACTAHFRSYVMDRWTNIDQVRIRLYRTDSVVAEMTFDGQGSTRISWLDISRLLTSSWTDMTSSSPHNCFSLTGLDWVYRRFYLSKFEAGCENDTGWLTVADTHPTPSVYGQCPWDYSQPLPALLYSPLSTAVRWQWEAAVADFMVVHVTFLD